MNNDLLVEQIVGLFSRLLSEAVEVDADQTLTDEQKLEVMSVLAAGEIAGLLSVMQSESEAE